MFISPVIPLIDTRIRIELMGSTFDLTDATVDIEVLDNGVSIGSLLGWIVDGGVKGTPGYAAAFLTPSAGSHVYTFQMNVSGSGAAEMNAGWYRIWEAPENEIVYVPRTTDFTVGDPQPVFTSGAIVYDGLTRVRLDVQCPRIRALNKKGAGDGATFTLKEDGVAIGDLGVFQHTNPLPFPGVEMSFPVFLRRFFTPSPGSHTYTVELTDVNVCEMDSPFIGGYLRITDPLVEVI